MRRIDESSDRANLALFDSPQTVEGYAVGGGLTPVERKLFETYLAPGSDILDLGVGAGRTIPYLHSIAGSYVGIDYAPGMIARCARDYPNVRLLVGDAANLSACADQALDAVVFSFNGIDYLAPHSKRQACLAEVRRVLRSQGIFIFSAHNAHELVKVPDKSARIQWNPMKTSAVAAFGTSRLLRRRLLNGALWRGNGYVIDSVQGLITHVATPYKVRRELREYGFVEVTHLSSRYPGAGWRPITPWYYYVYRKSK